jgi:mannan endo-1,4-beta-mannosidase
MSERSTLYTSGRFLRSRSGAKVILRGVNLPLLDDWAFPPYDYLSAVAQSHANAVRIQWYVNYGDANRPTYSLSDLDDILTRCAHAEMIPILMLADLTCAGDTSMLNSELVSWWTSSDVVAVLAKHSKYLVINLANEVGFYHWANGSQMILDAYCADYATAFASIRAQGLNCPIMVDAPDCGTSLDVFLAVGEKLNESDPQKNLLFSTHAYWAGYDGMPFIQQIVDSSLPVVFGEIANRQDEIVDGQTVFGYYALDGTGEGVTPANGFTYQALLTMLFHHETGWLAWSWGPDECTPRMLSTVGTFAALSAYGDDIINNTGYGLAMKSLRHKLL